MAQITYSQFKTDVYTRDLQLPELPDDASFFSICKRAVTNVRSALKSFEPTAFEEWLENQTSPVTFPDDLEQSEQTLFFRKGGYDPAVDTIGGQYIVSRGGKWYVEAFTGFNIKYPKSIPRATALGDTFPFKSEKAQEIMISEVMALINAAYEQNEATPGVTNALTQSNRIQ